MKNQLLTLLMFIAVAMQVACDDHKNSQQMASQCMSDPVCVQYVRGASGGVMFPLGQPAAGTAMAQVPTVLPAQMPTTLATNGLPKVLPTTIANKAFKSSEALNALIKTQSVKVAAGIAADDTNPNSDHYKIPTPTNLPSVSGAPATAAAAVRDPASAGGGGSSIQGEAAR